MELTVAIVGGDIISLRTWLEDSTILHIKDLLLGTVDRAWSTSCIFGFIR